jgi:hypothetical protein
LVRGERPRRTSALPPLNPRTLAAPKCISGRTSYLRVRLAFHPYPQVLRAVCNRHRCGPPRGLTRASACPWIAHPVSGRFRATQRAIHARFHCGSGYYSLSLATQNHSPVRSTKSTPSPLAWLRLVVGAGFQDLFHPPLPGCFSPFPHGTVRYRSARVPSLGGWSRLLPSGCRVSRRTHAPARSPHPFAYGALTRYGGLFQQPSAKAWVSHCVHGMPPALAGRSTPHAQRGHAWHAHGLGLHRFARRYSGAILLPPGT